jgi:ribosomal protein L37AE/L43A/transposase-like protein
MTFDEFTSRFTSEQECRDYLYQLRWPDGYICPKCQNQKSWKIGSYLYECTKCGHQASVIAGTIFQDTRKPLRTWFTAIWWVTTQKNGASAQGLQQILGLKSYETAWTWLHKIRKAMVSPSRTKLSGNIEVDEAYIGGAGTDGKRGRGSESKVLVAIAVEVIEKYKPGRVRLSVIPDASGQSLKAFVMNSVEKGSAIITDGWPSYSFLAESGYQHSKAIQNELAGDEKLLPHVHMIVSLLKRWLLGTHQGAVKEKHLQAYLDEYVFRFNRRKSAKRGLLFYRLLECAMAIKPITYDELVLKQKY